MIRLTARILTSFCVIIKLNDSISVNGAYLTYEGDEIDIKMDTWVSRGSLSFD